MAEISAKDVKSLRERTGAGMMDCKKALTEAEGEVERAIEILREKGLAKAAKRAGRDTSEGAVAISIEGGQGTIVELGCETDFVAKNEQFQKLVQEVADAVRGAAGVSDIEAALAAPMGGDSVEAQIAAAVGRVGENIQLKRVARIEAEGVVGGYVHGVGTLGVLVGLAGASGAEAAEAARDLAMHVAAADPTPLAVDRDGIDAAVIEKEQTILRAQALESGKPENIVDNMVKGRLNKFYAEHCLLEQAFVKDPDRKVGDVVGGIEGAAVIGFVRFKLGESAE